MCVSIQLQIVYPQSKMCWTKETSVHAINYYSRYDSIINIIVQIYIFVGSTSSIIAFNPEIVTPRQRDPKPPYSRPSSSSGLASPRLQTPSDMQGCYDLIRSRGANQSPSSQMKFNMRVGSHTSFTDYIPIFSEVDNSAPKQIDAAPGAEVRAKTPRLTSKAPPPPRAAVAPVTVIPRNLQKARGSEAELESKLRMNKAFIAPATSARKLGGGFNKQPQAPRKPLEARPTTGSLTMSLDGLEYSIHGHQIYTNSTMSFNTSKSEMDLARLSSANPSDQKQDQSKNQTEAGPTSPRDYLPVKDRPPTPFHHHITSSDSIELFPNDDGSIDVVCAVQTV